MAEKRETSGPPTREDMMLTAGYLLGMSLRRELAPHDCQQLERASNWIHARLLADWDQQDSGEGGADGDE